MLSGRLVMDVLHQGVHKQYITHNDITNEGFCAVLNKMFGSTNPSTYYMGLFTNYVNDSNYTHFLTVTSATWPAWVAVKQSDPGVAQVKNTTPVSFTVNSSGAVTLEGFFLTLSNVKDQSISTYVKWSTAIFDQPITLNNTDIINLTYTVTFTCA